MSAHDELNVMTYNIRNDLDSPPNSWEERKGLVQTLLQNESPDILATQECSYHQLLDMDSMLPGYDWIGIGRGGGSFGEFAATFYKKERLSVKEYDHFWLSDTPHIIGSTTWNHTLPRLVTWIHFVDKSEDRDFYHINTHFDHESEEARVKSAQLILQKLNYFNSDLPVFLTGDFNTDLHMDSYEILTKDHIFSDAWDMANRWETNNKQGSFNDFEDPNGGTEFIDWILVHGNHVQVQSVRVIGDLIDGRFPSDHFPIQAKIKW